MNNIEWKDGVVCYANYKQWFADELNCIDLIMAYPDFQLNEIRTGDYIKASELDTEQKYNDVVEVFGLFGFDCGKDAEPRFKDVDIYGNLTICHDGIYATELTKKWCKRKLTYNQIIAIGKLKRLMDETENSGPFKKPEKTEQLDFSNVKFSSNKCEREISDRQGNSANVDVYDVLKAFNVTCPATQDAVKELLCSGLRGHKNLQADLLEAKESIVRAIELSE